MRNNSAYLFLFIFSLCHFMTLAQTVWTGPKITFSKASNADWTLEVNQDRITANVWLTRASNNGIFNIAQEANFQGGGGSGPSPIDTEWAFGSISDGITNLNFTTWGIAHSTGGSGNPSSLINQNMVVHLITDDVYIDIKLLAWGSGGPNGDGGSFTYERSTNNLSLDQFQSLHSIKLLPNPTSNYIKISGLTNTRSYILFSLLGKAISTGTVANNQKISVQHLPKGVYLIKLENAKTLKFIKD
ncbi:MAG: T9SS type A sorting domain-containing protein [Kangiellaceae bacterium]|jgi:hypothetical protein|nr:T9SS type A sorting domain-containing protein [Kangiellaceae bacterium]